ncbi:hypothetical protein TNCV_4016921 [Trichonephila clavipes]|nr:hypothetical protein TNCV_4016921 [Trichonephila clavipes]
MDNGNGKCSALSNASARDCRAMFNSTRQISNVTFMQDGATSHTAKPVKAFLIQTFGEDRIVSRRCRYPWPPRSPDLTPADF